MSTPKPALIFDLGNVIAFFDYARACEPLGRRLGLTGPEFLAELRSRGFQSILASFERGTISPLEFSNSVSDLVGLKIDHDEFADLWADIFTLNEPVARIAVALKKAGHPLLLGSNTNTLHAAHFRAQFAETLNQFDRLILSYEVGEIKPELAFFEACARAAHREPGQCVFIDDVLENVEGARRAGLVGVHFRDTQSLLADLRLLGIVLDRTQV